MGDPHSMVDTWGEGCGEKEVSVYLRTSWEKQIGGSQDYSLKKDPRGDEMSDETTLASVVFMCKQNRTIISSITVVETCQQGH